MFESMGTASWQERRNLMNHLWTRNNGAALTVVAVSLEHIRPIEVGRPLRFLQSPKSRIDA